MFDIRIETVRTTVRDFLDDERVVSDVTVSERASGLERYSIAIAPKRGGAARLDLEVVLLRRGRWLVDVYLEGDERPIELSGPIDTSSRRRPVEESLNEILQLVSRGLISDERDNDGNLIGVNLPDTRDDLDASRRSPAYQPWRDY